MLRLLTAGESHGPAETAILEGIPSGLEISPDEIQIDLDKRKGGAGRGGRGLIEKDIVTILSGVRHGVTLGSPITLSMENRDFANWKKEMSVYPLKEDHPNEKKVTNPRPGHTDLAGSLKYGFSDIRNVLERASARETVMRVSAGAVCRKFLMEFGIQIASHTVQIGNIKFTGKNAGFETISKAFELNPEIRCVDPETGQKMKNAIDRARLVKNTLGGTVEIIAHKVPPGLGSYVHWDRKLDGRLAQALMSIPSVKAVEFGSGFENAARYGSDTHDEIYYQSGFYRKTNRAGGLEGGVSNGEDIICRVYHKPISTLGNPLNTVSITTKKTEKALIERSDICVVPRAGIISESMVAYILADSMLEKFGSDNLSDIKRIYKYYLDRIR